MNGQDGVPKPAMPDFSGVFARDTQDPETTTVAPEEDPRTKKPVVAGAMPDFSSVVGAAQPEPQGPPSLWDRYKESRQSAADEFRASKDELYSKLGIKGTLKDFVDIIPETYLKIVGATPADVGGAIAETAGGIGALGKKVYNDPLGATGGAIKAIPGMVEGFVAPFVQYPVELIANQHVSMGQQGRMFLGLDPQFDNKPLAPEEREEKAKSIGANVIAWWTGMKAEQIAEAALVGQEAVLGGSKALAQVDRNIQRARAAEAASTEAGRGIILDPYASVDRQSLFDMLYRKTEGVVTSKKIIPMGMREGITGAVGGAVGGFSMGFVEGDSSEEAIRSGMAYAAMAVPLGVALKTASTIFDLAKGKITGEPTRNFDMALVRQQYARESWNLRQLQFSTDQPSGMSTFNLNNLAEGQSMAAALATRQIEYRLVGKDKQGRDMKYGSNAVVIPTSNPIELVRIAMEHAGEDAGIATAVHTKPDGTSEVMIAPEDMPAHEQDFFKDTGHLHGQQVAYNGSTSWVIESIEPKVSGAKERQMTLRNLVTDEHVQSVKPSDLSRLDSTAPGDLRIHMGRMSTLSDIFDLGQGFMHAFEEQQKEPFTMQSLSSSLPGVGRRYGNVNIEPAPAGGPLSPSAKAKLKVLRAELKKYQGYDLVSQQQVTHRMMELEDLIQEIKMGEKKYLINGREAQPGINHFTTTQADGSETGTIIYMGGGTEMGLAADGVTPTPVQVGQPGTAVAYMTWVTEAGGTGRTYRASNSFWSAHDAPNRGLGTQQIIEEAARTNVRRSSSTLSTGSTQSMVRRVNIPGARVRFDPSRLTRYTGQALETHIMEDFLNFIGAKGDDRFFVNPHETLASRGWDYAPSEPLKGRPGESLETVRGRVADEIVSKMGPDRARTFTESHKPLIAAEAEALTRAQITADAVPTTRTTIDRAIDRTEVSWNDLVTAYASARGVVPEATQKLAQWLEHNIGKELIGKDSARSRLADQSKIPVLQDLVAKAKETLDKYKDEKSPLPYAIERIAEARAQVETFTERIEQIKRNDPLPFTDEERAVYTRLMSEAKSARVIPGAELSVLATEHGFAVESSGGKYRLRDMESDAVVDQAFDTPAEATTFLHEIGVPNKVDLDGGGNNLVPPSSVAGHMPPPEPQPRFNEVPHQFAPNTRVTKVINFLDTVAPWFTTKRQFFTAIDSTFGTRLYEDVYLPTQAAKMKTEAIKRPFLRKVQEIEQIMLSAGIPRDRWQRISEYRETMSPNEIVEKYLNERRMNSNEQTHARRLVNDNIDIPSVYSFTRAMGLLQRNFDKDLGEIQNRINNTQDPLMQMQLSKEVEALNKGYETDVATARAAFNMNDKHMQAHEMFKDVKGKPVEDMSLDAITRLARSMQDGELSRDEWAVKNKLSPSEKKAATSADALYKAVAQHLNIDQRLNGYLNHYRKYTQLPDNVPASLQDQILQEAAKDLPSIASELIRSGELNVYEKDPVNALIQYVNSTFANEYFNPVWKRAQKAAAEHLKAIPRGREYAKRVTDEYIGGLRGVPAASDEMAQLSFNKMLDALDVKVQPEIKRDLINTWLAAQSGAFLGFRPAQGLRDFTQFSKSYYSRFGASRYKNGLELAFKRDANGVMAVERFAIEGKIPGLSVLQFASDDELAAGLAGKAGKARDAIFSMSEAGLKFSAQSQSYSLAHAIAYADTYDLTSKTLLKLMRGEIDKQKAYKILSMNSYDIPVAEGFDRLVSAGKTTDAAEYLAQSTGAETAFLFGMSNHPYGWGTNVGKLAGSLGTWSIWDRNYLTRLAGRGTPGERAASMARLASAEIATGVAGRALGFNMRSWYMIPGMLFAGGPAFGYVEQLEDMMGQRGKLRETLAKRMLTHSPPGQLPIISQVTPGASAVSDYFQAWQLNKNRYGVVPVLGKALGMSVDQTQRSWLDELISNHPRLKK